MALLIPTGRASAATAVTGDQDANAPLVIEPSSDPQTNSLSLWSNMPEVVYIQDMPVAKRIRRVTLRDLASADSCGSNASVHLIVRHRPRDDHPRGDRNQIAISSAPKLLSKSFEEVSWDIPDVTLKRGETYSFQLLSGDLGSCTDLKQRTWAHNASQVNGGDALREKARGHRRRNRTGGPSTRVARAGPGGSRSGVSAQRADQQAIVVSYAFRSLPRRCRPVELLVTIDSNDDGRPGFTQLSKVTARTGEIRINVPAALELRPDVAKASSISTKRARSRVAIVLIS